MPTLKPKLKPKLSKRLNIAGDEGINDFGVEG